MERSRPRLRRKNLRKWARFRMIVVPPPGFPLCADFAHNRVSCPVTSLLDHALNVLESTGLTRSGKPVSFFVHSVHPVHYVHNPMARNLRRNHSKPLETDKKCKVVR